MNYQTTVVWLYCITSLYLHLFLAFLGSLRYLPEIPGIDSTSKRNEYHEYFRGDEGGWWVGLTTLTPLCSNCLENWEPQPLGTPRASACLYRDCFTYTSLRSAIELVYVQDHEQCIFHRNRCLNFFVPRFVWYNIVHRRLPLWPSNARK